MVVLHGGQVFVFGFKLAHGEDGKDAAEQAIGQLLDKGYADKYQERNEPTHLVGVALSAKEGNLAAPKVVST